MIQQNKIQDNIGDLLTKGCRVQCLIQCVGLWFAGGKYGCSWKIVQVKVNPSKSISGYSFIDDSDDEEEDDNSNKLKADSAESDDEVVEDSDLEVKENENNSQLVAVLFTDIDGFTELSEKMSSKDILDYS